MSTLAILKNLSSLVGDEAFNAAVAELGAGGGGAGEVAPKKARKVAAVDPEKSAKRSAEMGALQNFIKSVRAEHPEGTAYKEVQKVAGERWKTMDAAARAAYAAVAAEAPVAEAAPKKGNKKSYVFEKTKKIEIGVKPLDFYK